MIKHLARYYKLQRFLNSKLLFTHKLWKYVGFNPSNPLSCIPTANFHFPYSLLHYGLNQEKCLLFYNKMFGQRPSHSF